MSEKSNNRLENLVPPLELCKLIPAGEFGNSALVRCIDDVGTVVLCERENAIHTEGWKKIPAPTLQEIMVELPHDDAYNDLLIGYSAKVDKLTGWHIYYNGERNRHCYDQSAVTAALELWLKLKGIKDE